MPIVRPAPTLGEHSQEVFFRVLGMNEEQYQALKESGITGNEATKK